MMHPYARPRLGTAIGVVAATAMLWLVYHDHREAGSGPVAVAPSSRVESGSVPATKPTTMPGARSGRPWEDIQGWDRLTPHGKMVALLSQPIGLLDHGRVERLEAAKDELYVPGRQGGLKKIAALIDAEALLARAEELREATGAVPQLVFYPPGAERTDSNRRVLNGRLLLRTATSSQSLLAATAAGLEKVGQLPGPGDGCLVMQDRRTPGSSLLAAAELAGRAGIASAQPMLARALKKMSYTPKDPLFPQQWHLKNTGQAGGIIGVDANVFPVWSSYQGTGVVIGIVDDGVESTHPDLSPNYHAEWSTNIADSSIPPDPQSASDNHGTAVAGVAAAAGNAIGVSGAAPQASIANIRLLDYYVSEDMEAQALGFSNDTISVKNNSWGIALEPWELGTLTPAVLDSLQDAATNGRGQKGTIMTFAAGNDLYQVGLQGSKAGYPSNIYVIAVGAVTASGVRSYYSESGAHLLTCAPSDGGIFDPTIVTTDRSGALGFNNAIKGLDFWSQPEYTSTFGGTSSATAVVSGVVALMLQANPQLGWRDVKEILLRSGTKVDSRDPDWVSRSGGSATLPPIKHNHQYGGGMVNAVSAVALAKTWTNLDTMATLSHTYSGQLPVPIPDYDFTGTTLTLDFSQDAPMRVEQVEVVVDVQHSFRGDVSIDLVSPSGTVSHLVQPSDMDTATDDYNPFDGSTPPPHVYPNFTFSSARHWGESSSGLWKVVFRDLTPTRTGAVYGATISLHGVAAPRPLISTPPQDLIAAIGAPASMQVIAGGFPDLSYQWLKGTAKIAGATTDSYAVAKASLGSAGIYTVQVSNLTGRQTGNVNLGAVDTTSHAVIFNEGSTLTLQATAAGPGIQYQWNRNGTSMTDDAPGVSQRIIGTRTSRLTVRNVSRNDVDTYACAVTVGTASAVTGDFNVQVRIKPQLVDPVFNPTIVSDIFTLPLPVVQTAPGVDGSAVRYLITGLPSGLTYNAVTGLITGRPNVGSLTPFTIKITPSNAAGSGATATKTLVISSLPATAVGTFNGLVAPSLVFNGGFGGTLNVVVATTGTYSGRLTLGSAAYVFSGRLTATLYSDPTAAVVIRRTGTALPLTLSFGISRTDGHLTGAVADTSLTSSSSLEGWQNPFSPVNRATGLAATYSLWIDPPAATPGPEGSSYGFLTVNSLGGATWTGRLADNTAVSRTTTISQGGNVPLNFMLYSGTGSAQGWVQATNQSPALNTAGGTMNWVKNAQPPASTTRSYKTGFALNGMTVTGGVYARPASGTVLWGLTNVNSTPGATNARLAFSKGGLESAANFGALTATGMRVLLSSSVQAMVPNPTVLRMSVNPATGYFTGSATLQDSMPALVRRGLVFYGVICTGQSKGRGYFVLPELPNTATTPILSGLVDWVAGP